MSTLKVNKLRDTAGSADAITLDPNGGAVLAGVTTMTTARVTSGIVTNTFIVGAGVTISESGIEASGIGITCASINGTQIGGRKNIYINGAMTVAQRGTSSTEQGYKTVDRIKTLQSGPDEVGTQSQGTVASGTTPYSLGFRKSFKLTNGNQTSGAGTGDVCRFQARLESQDIADSGWDFKDPNSKLTLSFWCKSSVAQNFYVQLVAYDGSTYSYTFETGALTADTWTKVVHSIPGNSNIQFDNDANVGLEILWYQFQGTDRTASDHSTNTWAAYASGSQSPDMTSTWYTTDEATWELTGVQLEVGPQATAFEHRSFGDELNLCKRYYEQFNSEGLSEAPFGVGYFESDTQLRAVVPLHEKRADVSFSSSDASTFASMNTNNMPAGSSISLYKTGKKAAIILLTLSSSVTSGDGRAGILCAQSSTEATLKFDSEL